MQPSRPRSGLPSGGWGLGTAPPRAGGRLAVAVALPALLALWVAGAWLRIRAPLAHPAFDRERAESVVYSDPALLLHLTQQAVRAGGIPDAWSAERSIAHPDALDVPATYTVGQELLVAALRPLAGPDVSLHVFCLVVMAFVAAASVFGVFLLALELTRAPPVALAAAACWTLLPASYRTIGFVLMREDLALPLFALHLALAVRAVRSARARDAALAALALAAALATWHALSLVAALEALVVLAAFVLRRPSESTPASARPFAAAAIVLVAAALAVPALRAKGAYLGPPVAVAVAVALAARACFPRTRAAVALGVAAALVALGAALTAGASDFGHVARTLAEKLAHLGSLPSDPRVLSFETRMLWQGPFTTLGLTDAWAMLHLALPLAPLAIVAHAWRAPHPASSGLAAFVALALVAAWLAQRMVVLPALLVPALAASLALRASGARRAALLAAVLAAQGALFASWYARYPIPWYSEARAAEHAALVRAIEEHVPHGAAVAADFMVGPTVLATTGRPSILQPKWETAASRERVRRFWLGFHAADPASFRRMLTDEYDCRWLLVDRQAMFLSYEARYLAGYAMTEQEPHPGTAAWATCATDDERLRSLPGYELVWRSPPHLRDPATGRRSDFFRLYRLE